jgi:hypothetical protein
MWCLKSLWDKTDSVRLSRAALEEVRRLRSSNAGEQIVLQCSGGTARPTGPHGLLVQSKLPVQEPDFIFGGRTEITDEARSRLHQGQHVEAGDQQPATRARSGRRSVRLGDRQSYEDAGISEAKGRDQRPGLDAMLKAVNTKEFDMVPTWSVDRLGRSLTGGIRVRRHS